MLSSTVMYGQFGCRGLHIINAEPSVKAMRPQASVDGERKMVVLRNMVTHRKNKS